MLVVMGPVLQVSVARLYAGALLPGLLLAGPLPRLHDGARVAQPEARPAAAGRGARRPARATSCASSSLGLLPPAALIIATLGSIVTGWATPTEGAALGCVGALVVTAAHRKLTWAVFKDSVFRTAQTVEHGDDPARGLDLPGLGVLRARHADLHRQHAGRLEHPARRS